MGSYVLQAVRLIMLWADRFGQDGVPLVINFSYGLLAGPKDGTQKIEQALFADRTPYKRHCERPICNAWRRLRKGCRVESVVDDLDTVARGQARVDIRLGDRCRDGDELPHGSAANGIRQTIAH